MTDTAAAAAAERVFADLDEGNLSELYEHFHAAPELSMQEEETAATVAAHLEEDGYDVHRVGGGVVGILENGDGPRVLMRADMDGLPVREDTDLPYASTRTQTDRDGDEQPVMHACGHDVHMAAGLVAARQLAAHHDEWSGTYVALFQPGEETAEGARSMIDDGLAEVVGTSDVALAQHVLSGTAGHVVIAAGPVMSTATSLRLTVYGTGTHGSMPHLGIDPVVLAAAIVMRIQGVVSREIPPAEFGVVTVGALRAGSAANVISDSATLRLNFRAYSEETLTTLTEAVERIVRAECAASNSPREPEFTYSAHFPLTENDPDATEKVRAALVAHLGEERVVEMSPVQASEDFSLVPRELGIPYVYWGVGGFGEGDEVVANHHPRFAPRQDPTLRAAAEAAGAAALAWLAG